MERNIKEIQVGWTAYDETGDKLGEVADVGGNYVLVEKGPFIPTDVFIPSSSIDSIDARDSVFTVAVLKEDVESSGWDSPPSDAPPGENVTVPYRS
jgi:hypothetical protein